MGNCRHRRKIGGDLVRSYSVVSIHNDTEHDMTLRYSGPDSFEVVFAPNEKASLEILIGIYKVAASVTALNVIPYAGEYRSTGSDGVAGYYIGNQFDAGLDEGGSLKGPRPRHSRRPTNLTKEDLEGLPWPCKRLLPAYLK